MGTFVNPSLNPGGTEPIADPNNAIRYLDNERQVADQRLSLMGKELMILGEIIKEQMTDGQYAETRKRIEAELFPPAPSIDQAAVDRIKEEMESMQKENSDFRNETQGMLRDLAEGIREMTAHAQKMREPQPAEDDLDRGTALELEPPDDWQCPECSAMIPTSEIDTHKCNRPPYVCPNCNEEVPYELKNEHVCKRAEPAPKKRKRKKPSSAGT